MSEERNADYWLRKMRLWRILHPSLNSLLRCGGENKKCPNYGLGNKCRVGVLFFASSDFTKGFVGTVTEINNAKLPIMYCAEWIRHE